MIALPRAFGPAVLEATLRSRPEDFRVDELLGFAPDGRGEHLLLRVEKRGANTAWVAKQLARWAGVQEFAVSYAGLKDRHAVTVQTFSLHLPGREPPAEWPVSDEYRVLDAVRHGRKLQRGALRGNRFVLTLRDVAGDRAAIEQRLQTIAVEGVPNAFGEQRFGRGGSNLDAARAMFAGRRVRREERAILLSAARSELFNAVLAARVADGSWNRGVDGDVWMLDGSHSVFGPEALTDELRARAASFDVHPTGPMWGSGELRTADAARAIEDAALQPHADLLAPLAAAGLRQERRSLRLRIGDLQWRWIADDVLEIAFALPAGSYATSVVHELGMTRASDAASGAGSEQSEE